MAQISQYSRFKHHRLTTSGQLFTIPTSEDHTDETWLSTDLYIGELGINLTDDTIFMRTNNGIVQIGTTGSSGTSTSTIWNWSSPNIEIGSSYSADSVSPRSGYYTDLGNTTNRWKDLFLGGSSGGTTQIDVNSGVYIVSSNGGILASDGVANTNSPIEIHTFSGNSNKNRPLWLNTRYGSTNGSTNYITCASSQTVTTDDSSYVFIAATNQLSIDNGLSHIVHLGKSFNRNLYQSDTVSVGGSLAVRGTDDDGSGQYGKSEWITTQSKLATSDALFYDLVNLPWSAATGEVIQVKAYIVATVIDGASTVYSSEIMGAFSIDDAGDPFIIGTPIKNEVSSWIGTQPEIEFDCDVSGIYLKAKGVGTANIQWLCSYSYHRLIGVL